MGHRPTVSVVIPTYDRAEYLRQALESALAQTYTDFEVVVTDNSMSADTAALVSSYGDRRVRYRHNGGNIGALANALAGFRSTRGQFVASLHDDDAWEPRFLERLVPPLLEDPSLVLAFSDHFLMDADGVVDLPATDRNTRLWGRHGLAPGKHAPFTRLALVDRAVPVAMASVFRRAAVDWDAVPTEAGAVYDLWLVYLACRDGGGAYYVPERLTRYRTHASAHSATHRIDTAFLWCYEHFLSDPRLQHLRPELRRAVARFRTGAGIGLLREGRRADARRLLARALREHPQPRAAGALLLSVLPPRGV
jgi:glycosyltransferase involved in cell wall biosynthesis